MVLADAEDVEADFVGELDLLHEVLHSLRGGDVVAAFDERVDAEFHVGLPRYALRSGRSALVQRTISSSIACADLS